MILSRPKAINFKTMNLNKAIIVGRLTRDPEARTTTSGHNLTNFALATNRVWNDQQGNRQESTEFHNIVAFGRLAEICSQYLNKGRLVLIEGRIQTRSWQDQNGVKKYRTEIVAENMQMGPGAQTRNDNFSAGQNNSPAPAQSNEKPSEDIPVIDSEEPIDSQEEPITNQNDGQPEQTESQNQTTDQEINPKNIPF